MLNADIESWALARAHHIVLNEGLNLAKAAQDLDRKRSRSLVYELRKVITQLLSKPMLRLSILRVHSGKSQAASKGSAARNACPALTTGNSFAFPPYTPERQTE